MGGLNAEWQKNVTDSLEVEGISWVLLNKNGLTIISIREDALLVNLLDLSEPPEPEVLLAIQEDYSSRGVQLVHLWEDVWLSRKTQVLSRIKSILGLNKRIHGRKTKIVSIAQDVADAFLIENHLQYSASARYKYALQLDGVTVAVACFSHLRKMPEKGILYRSAELIRFATIDGYTVTGGFTKLLRYFIKLHEPNDVMSYADRDWSLGAAYQNAGFKLVGVTAPASILVDRISFMRYFSHRVDSHITGDKYLSIFNTGNLKYILYL